MPLEAIVPAPYSQDLRQRVIGFMALGGSARAAAMRFDVSVSSAIRWAQRWRAEGHARPRAMGGDRRSRLGEHRARVLQLVARQPDLTLQEICGALAAGLSQTSGVDGRSGMAVDFTLRCRGAAYDPECDCRET